MILLLIDADGCCCGIVDDIRLDGAAGAKLEIGALLVRPAPMPRLPRWAQLAQHAARRASGDDRCVGGGRPCDQRRLSQETVPFSSASHVAENKARALIPRRGAL